MTKPRILRQQTIHTFTCIKNYVKNYIIAQIYQHVYWTLIHLHFHPKCFYYNVLCENIATLKGLSRKGYFFEKKAKKSKSFPFLPPKGLSFYTSLALRYAVILPILSLFATFVKTGKEYGNMEKDWIDHELRQANLEDERLHRRKINGKYPVANSP